MDLGLVSRFFLGVAQKINGSGGKMRLVLAMTQNALVPQRQQKLGAGSVQRQIQDFGQGTGGPSGGVLIPRGGPESKICSK